MPASWVDFFINPNNMSVATFDAALICVFGRFFIKDQSFSFLRAYRIIINNKKVVTLSISL